MRYQEMILKLCPEAKCVEHKAKWGLSGWGIQIPDGFMGREIVVADTPAWAWRKARDWWDAHIWFTFWISTGRGTADMTFYPIPKEDEAAAKEYLEGWCRGHGCWDSSESIITYGLSSVRGKTPWTKTWFKRNRCWKCGEQLAANLLDGSCRNPACAEPLKQTTVRLPSVRFTRCRSCFGAIDSHAFYDHYKNHTSAMKCPHCHKSTRPKDES